MIRLYDFDEVRPEEILNRDIRAEADVEATVDAIIADVRARGDLFLLHQWIRNEPVDLLIGNTYGKYIARDEDLPFIRWGFPILDRQGHQYFPTVGYKGGLRFLEKVLDALLDRQDRDAPEEKFELVY